MKKLYIMLFAASAVAIAGAALPVHASEVPTSTPIIENIEPDFSFSQDVLTPDQFPGNENPVQDFQSPTPDIASESESIGEFGNDDSSIDDAYQDFIDSVGDSGFDFYSPSPTFFPEEGDEPVSTPELTPSPTPTIIPFFEDDSIEPYSSYNTYYGSIGSTYLEFMRGFLPKLGFKEHYVASRTSQYDYIFAFGEDLIYSGGRFSGIDITVITWNTYNNGSYSSGVQSSFSLNPGSYLVYSDLSDFYPSLADSSGFTLRQILILLTMFILGIVIDHMYQVRKIRRIK